MAADATAAPAAPAATTPAAPAEKGGIAEAVGERLIKDLTMALVASNQINRLMLQAFHGRPPANEDDDGENGLIPQLAALQDSIDQLDLHVVGQNVMLARQEFIDDELFVIWKGNPDATPPVPGREPTPADRMAALEKYNATLAAEAAKAPAPDDDEFDDEPDLPEKPPEKTMIANSPKPALSIMAGPRKLPPPPVVTKPPEPPPAPAAK